MPIPNGGLLLYALVVAFWALAVVEKLREWWRHKHDPYWRAEP
jgi:hypothetical protein